MTDNATVIPTAYILVKGGGLVKHAAKALHLGRVPAPDVLVEGGGEFKHQVHIINTARVPAPKILVERGLCLKQVLHVGNKGRVPGRNVPVRFRRVGLVGKPEVARHADRGGAVRGKVREWACGGGGGA